MVDHITVVSVLAGAKVAIVKGCKARGIAKGTSALIRAITPVGDDETTVKVVFVMLNGIHAGKQLAFYARHINRLSDPIVNLNDGNPLHTIQMRVRK